MGRKNHLVQGVIGGVIMLVHAGVLRLLYEAVFFFFFN